MPSGYFGDVSADIELTVVPPVVPSELTLTLKHESGLHHWFSSGAILNGKVLSTWSDGTRAWDCVTGVAVVTPAIVNDYNGNPLGNTQLENGECVPVGAIYYRGSQAPGGPFHRFDPATGIYTDVAATSYADSAMLYDKPANRIIGISGGGYPFIQWPLPIPDLPSPSVNEYPSVVMPPCPRYMMWNACINVEAGRAMMLGNDNEVYEMESGTYAFIPRPTTGEKPPPFSKPVYWPAWDAYIVIACGDNDPDVPQIANRFWKLRRSDWNWQELTVTMPGPVVSNIYQNIILADPEREQIIIINGNGQFYSLGMT